MSDITCSFYRIYGHHKCCETAEWYDTILHYSRVDGPSTRQLKPLCRFHYLSAGWPRQIRTSDLDAQYIAQEILHE